LRFVGGRALTGEGEQSLLTYVLRVAAHDHPSCFQITSFPQFLALILIIVLVVFSFSIQRHSVQNATYLSTFSLSPSSSNQRTIRKTLPLLSTSVSKAFLSSPSTTMDKHVEPEQTADADKGDTLVLEKVSVLSTMDDSSLMAHLRTMLGRALSRDCSRPSRRDSKNKRGCSLPTKFL